MTNTQPKDSAESIAKRHARNIDGKDFCDRQLISAELRHEHPNCVPTLLYWHPDVGSRGSVPAASIFQRFAQFGKSIFAAVSDTETPAKSVLVKLIVSKRHPLSHLEKCVRESLINLAATQLCTGAKPDVTDLKKITLDHRVCFYSAKTHKPWPLDTLLEKLDRYDSGDDNFLRLMVSIERLSTPLASHEQQEQKKDTMLDIEI